MKKIITLIAVFLLSTFNSFAQETITNETIIQMQELGFDDTMIIDKINSSNVDFDASISALTELKNAGVSTDILSVVMKKSKSDTKSQTGIYFLSATDDLDRILPSVFSSSNSNATAQKLVSGFINSKQKAQLLRTQSNNIIKSGKQKFVFIFSSNEIDNMQTGMSDWWFKTATSPNEFVLVKLDVNERKNLREMVIGKSSSLSSTKGISAKDAIDFTIEEMGNNKFKVATPEPLSPGEYCFIYQGNVPTGRANQSVFDFSIQ
ncbi:hypothetical protein ACFFVB_10195 [Formosa undariae]|uniref:Uncharacterized protein n=1 Tax=Formosa undariae TaxID=1325436 RepID=A0ABV5F1Y2_9FLAO